MARPKGVIETHPRKEIIRNGSTDGQGYRKANSGCEEATLFLGYGSLCLKCPFPEKEAPCYRNTGRKDK